MVHFAGHSLYQVVDEDRDIGRGLIFVGEPDAPEVVKFNEIAPRLKNTKLLYLSSCKGASTSFAVDAAKASGGSLVVAGFRTAVDDEPAHRYALEFYRQFLTRRSIDAAFLHARRKLHKELGDDPTWASALLVAGQTSA